MGCLGCYATLSRGNLRKFYSFKSKTKSIKFPLNQFVPSAFKILAILTVLIFVFSCSSNKGFLPYEGLKGQPTQVKILDFEPLSENSTQEPKLESWEIYEFDKIGRKISYQVFRSDSTPVTGGSRFYYSNKGPVQYQENFDLKGSLQSRTDFTYDQKGRFLKSRTLAGGKETSLKEISYDRKRPISNTKITYNGKAVMQNSVDSLDEKGRIVLMTDYLPNGGLKGKLGYAYDKNGNVILQEWYNSEGQLFQFYKKTYNERNEEILNEGFEIIAGKPVKSSSETRYDYLYDSLGNQSQVSVKTGGKIYIKKVIVTYPDKK